MQCSCCGRLPTVCQSLSLPTESKQSSCEAINGQSKLFVRPITDTIADCDFHDADNTPWKICSPVAGMHIGGGPDSVGHLGCQAVEWQACWHLLIHPPVLLGGGWLLQRMARLPRSQGIVLPLGSPSQHQSDCAVAPEICRKQQSSTTLCPRVLMNRAANQLRAREGTRNA